MKLSIKTNQIDIPIERDGEAVGSIALNPADVTFAQGFAQLCETYNERLNAYLNGVNSGEFKDDLTAQLDAIRSICDGVNGKIDGLFGDGTAELIFGGVRTPDVYGQFFDGISSIMEESRKENLSRYLDEPTAEDGLE